MQKEDKAPSSTAKQVVVLVMEEEKDEELKTPDIIPASKHGIVNM